MLRCALIGAGARWTGGYHPWVSKNSDAINIVAIAEPIAERRAFHQRAYKLADDACFDDWESMLAAQKDKTIDGVIICSPDAQHYHPAMSCLNRGYNILLEKPMAQSVQQCIDIVQCAKKNDCKVMLGHVLRYTAFFMKIKELIADDAIGAVQSIQHAEQVGYFHIAHSFVRGNWSKKEASNPIILAKSCHDLDILLYILGDAVKATKVASFGSLNYLTEKNAPPGAPRMCSDVCPVYDSCPYSIRMYVGNRNFSPFTNPEQEITEQNLARIAKTNPYGRCVYHCDNDVCDSMSTIIQFDNGVHATFTLSGFTDEITRTINIMGSHGQIVGDMEQDELQLMKFGAGDGPYQNRAITTYHPQKEATAADQSGYSGHGGGDSRLILDFANGVRGEGLMLTDISRALHSHVMGFAIEKARIEEKIISIEEFMSHYHA